MRYLLDANVLIDADRDYYPLERVPEFWTWLGYEAEQGVVRMPSEMYEEIVVGNGELVDWLKAQKDILVLAEEADPILVQNVLSNGYAPDLAEDELQKIGRDPFIVGYALAWVSGTTVVTTEVSKPTRQRGNRRLPDVCGDLNVRCINTFKLLQELNFSTGWHAR